MNVLKSGMLAAVAGTTTPVMRVTDRYEIDEFAFTNRHGVPGLWLQEGNAGITGLALRWVRDLFRTDYEIMTQEAMSVPLGCDGMRCFSGHELQAEGLQHAARDLYSPLHGFWTAISEAIFQSGIRGKLLCRACKSRSDKG